MSDLFTLLAIGGSQVATFSLQTFIIFRQRPSLVLKFSYPSLQTYFCEPCLFKRHCCFFSLAPKFFEPCL